MVEMMEGVIKAIQCPHFIEKGDIILRALTAITQIIAVFGTNQLNGGGYFDRLLNLQ